MKPFFFLTAVFASVEDTRMGAFYRTMVLDHNCLGEPVVPLSDEEYLSHLAHFTDYIPIRVRRTVLEGSEEGSNEHPIYHSVSDQRIRNQVARLEALEQRLSQVDPLQSANTFIEGLYPIWADVHCNLGERSASPASSAWTSVLDGTLRRSANMINDGNADQVEVLSSFVVPVLLKSSRGDIEEEPVQPVGPMARATRVELSAEDREAGRELLRELGKCCFDNCVGLISSCIRSTEAPATTVAANAPIPVISANSPEFVNFVKDALSRLQDMLTAVALTTVSTPNMLEPALTKLRNEHLRDVNHLLMTLTANVPPSTFQIDPSKEALLALFDLLLNNSSNQDWGTIRHGLLMNINNLQEQFTKARMAVNRP